MLPGHQVRGAAVHEGGGVGCVWVKGMHGQSKEMGEGVACGLLSGCTRQQAPLQDSRKEDQARTHLNL